MTHFSADIVKIDKKQHVVEGYATTTSTDRDKQSMDADFLKREFPKWADKYGNIRYMHQPKVVGKVIDRSDWDGRGYYITAKIHDPQTWDEIENGMLNGFSIGIKGGTLAPDPMVPNGKYIDGEIIETSVVDVPSNRDSDFVAVKSATYDTQKGEWQESMLDDVMCAGLADGIADSDIDAYKRYYSDKERNEMDESDFAGPHRSFPVKTQDDVDNAARLIGHASDPEAVKRRIIEIAHRKGFSIPDAWKENADKTIDTSSGLQPYNLEGDKEEKTTVTDEKTVSPEEEKVVKAAEFDAMRTTLDGLVTSFSEIRGLIEAMASKVDPDKDGDVDDTMNPDYEAGENPAKQEPVESTGSDAPNSVKDTLVNGLKAAFADPAIVQTLVDTVSKTVEAQIESRLNVVTKSTTADNTSIKTMIANVQKVADSLQTDLTKFSERLEVVEQSAAPAKGVTMVVEKFAGADGEQVDENAKIAEIAKTVAAQNKGLSPVIIQQRVDEAIKAYKGGNKQ